MDAAPSGLIVRPTASADLETLNPPGGPGRRGVGRPEGTAAVEFWEDKRDELVTRFQGRWPVTTAAEHVGYETTQAMAHVRNLERHIVY